MAATEEIEKEILAEMAANPVPYAAGQVNDVITIDGETRMISVPASEIFFGVESDKDVERKHFRCPKVVGDGIDLSKHQIYISYITSDSAGKTFSGNAGLYLCEDVATDGDDITFSWQLSGNVFASAGFIAFKVLAAKTDGENVQTRWNTVPAIGTVLMTVPDGMDIGEAYPDIVTQLLERMASVEKIATEEAMQGYVNTYLEAHPGEIDETLTDPKKAAPASVVGELKEDLDNFRFYESNGFFKFISNWHNGDIDSAGEFVDSKFTRRSDKVEASLLKCVEIITHNHNGCSVREWDINGRYLGSSWVASSENIESRTNTFDFKSDTAYIAFTITGSNNYNANENNVDIKIFIDDYFLNDKSLQKALKIKKGFVSPVADFGAYGDGLHNDTEALQNCLKFCIENSVSLKCEKAYQFMITNTLELIGIDNSYTTGESENIVRTFKTINAEFDFNGSTILAYGNFAESSHTALYEGEEIPSVLYIKSTNLYDMRFEIKNLFIDARKINCVCIYADELKKSTFRNITIKHLSKIGIYIESNCGGIMFYDTQMIANKKKAIGFWNASSDCYFDGIYMVDVTYGMILSASYSNIKKFHPFILTPSFILGSVMFKLLSRNASGEYVGESTIILDQCYADTYNVVFDVSSHIGHRIISTGMTYINNTQILNNLFGKDTPSKMICVFTRKNEGYANKVKLSSNYMSGYKKDDNVYTYLCDSAGDESIIDNMSVISNVNYNNGELIN